MARLHSLVVVGCASLLAFAAPAFGAGGALIWQDEFDLAGFDDRADGVAAAHGLVVTVGNAQTAPGNSDFIVRAYAASSGAKLWQDHGNLGRSTEAKSVALNGRHVVVGVATIDLTGNDASALRAYLASNGRLVWTDTWQGGRSIGFAIHESGKLVAAGMVRDSTGVSRLRVRSYVAGTGRIEWEDQTAIPAGLILVGVGPRGVAIHGRTAFVAITTTRSPQFLSLECVVRAYDIPTGRRIWETAGHLGGGICGPNAIAADGRRVVVAAQDGVEGSGWTVQGYDASTGRPVWSDRGESVLQSILFAVDVERRRAFVAGSRFFALPGQSATEAFVVRSYDTATGAVLWEQFHNEPHLLWYGLDVEAAGRFVFGFGQNVETGTWLVRALNIRDGSVAWENQFRPPTAGGVLSGAVAVNGGRLFVAGSGNNAAGNRDLILRAYDAK